MKDLFSTVARDYARYRPVYPAELFERLASLAPRRGVAWDCATGNGQAAVALAAHFPKVIATDGSVAQLAEARPHPRVSYLAMRAEAPGLRTGSIDLVTVAQALHWLDLSRFWPEVHRVLGAGGVVAAWCYNLCRISPDIDRVVEHFYRNVVGRYWAPERASLEAGYRTLPFPFHEVRLQVPDMRSRFTLDALIGFVGTWSATDLYRKERGEDPLPALRDELAQFWGDADAERDVAWPLSVRVGRTTTD